MIADQNISNDQVFIYKNKQNSIRYPADFHLKIFLQSIRAANMQLIQLTPMIQENHMNMIELYITGNFQQLLFFLTQLPLFIQIHEIKIQKENKTENQTENLLTIDLSLEIFYV